MYPSILAALTIFQVDSATRFPYPPPRRPLLAVGRDVVLASRRVDDLIATTYQASVGFTIR
jgi:hypothetical protein